MGRRPAPGRFSRRRLPPVRLKVEVRHILGDAGEPNRRRRLQMPLSFSMIVLSSQMVIAGADGVPKYNMAPNCKLDVAATAGLSVDQSLKACVRDEQKAQQQLGSQWSKFPAASR